VKKLSLRGSPLQKKGGANFNQRGEQRPYWRGGKEGRDGGEHNRKGLRHSYKKGKKKKNPEFDEREGRFRGPRKILVTVGEKGKEHKGGGEGKN